MGNPFSNLIQGWKGFFNPSISATIANSAQISSTINCGGLSLVGIQLPAAFTGTALTFLACDTQSGTFQPVYNSSGLVSYTVAAGYYVAINPQDFYGVAFLQIKSGSAEGADRTLTISLKGL